GDPVTARDFVYALNRTAWPETKSSYVFELEVIQGTKDVESGATREISGVKALDDSTLQFTLSEPAAYFLAMTATFTFAPVSQDPTLSKQMLRSPLLQARWIAFNVSKPPFDNQALREAIAYSIDRSRLADLAFSGTVESACTEAPPNMIWAGKPPFCWPSADA